MKRLRKMALLLAVFVLLLAGYYGLSGMQETQSVTETSGTFELHAFTEDTLTGLSWQNENGLFDFDRQDGVWVKADEPGFPVNQTALDNLAKKMIELTGTREIANAAKPEDYGLDTPAFSVTLAHAQDGDITYAMGDETPFADGYYLSVSGSDAIYTVESALDSVFSKTLTQLCALEEIPETGNVTRMSISGALNAAYDEGTGLWTDTVSGETLDEDGMEDLIATAQGVEWTALAASSVTEEGMSAYGLDEAQAVVIRLEGGEDEAMEILLGMADEDGNRYARLPGSAMVYTVEGETAEELLGAGVDTLWNKAPVRIAYEDMASAQFVWESGSLSIAGGAQIEETDGEEAAGAQDDGQSAEESLWKKVAALSGKERVAQQASGGALLTIRYTDAQGAEASAEIHPYDAESYLIPISETHAMLVSAAEVDTIIRVLKTM